MDFQDGQTKVINGVTYVRRGGVWQSSTPMAPARQPSPQTAPQAQQDVLQVEKLRNDVATIPLDRQNKAVNIQQGQKSIENTDFGNEGALRDKYNALPEVKNYGDALTALDSMFKAPQGPQGDLAIIYGFAKAMDPGSVVREGEMDMANSTASTVAQLRQKYKTFLDGKGLPPEVRTGLIEAARQKVAGFKPLYEQQRERYSGLAGQHKFKPESVVGPALYDAVRPDEEAYITSHGGTPRDPNAPVDVAPSETVGGFGLKPDPRNTGLTPEQAGVYDAFFKANPNATPEQLQMMARAAGIGEIGNAQEIIDHYKKQGQISHDVQVRPDISDVRGGENTAAQDTINAVARGVPDTLSFGLLDKGVALGDTMFKGGTFDQNLQRQFSISDYDQQNHPYARLGGQVLGGAVLPMGEMRTAGQVIGKSAAVGAAYGAGSSRSLGDVPTNALIGAGGGAAVSGALTGAPRAIGAGVRAVGRRVAGETTPEQNALLRAGAEEGVPVNMADVYPQTRNAVSTLESMPGASGQIRHGIEAGRDAMEQRVQHLGNGGVARENMGEAIQDSGRRYIASSRQQADRLYGTARQQADGTQIRPTNTMQSLMQLVRQEGQVPGGTRAGAVIQRYADAFENGGPITIDGARAMRSELLSRLRDDGGLTRSQASRITGQIMGAVNRDIETALTQSGRQGAVQAYRSADQFYAQRMDEIETVVQKFLGTERNPKSPEQAMQVMRNMAGPRGDAGRMTRMLAHMTPEERGDFAATLVEPLGRRATDEPFSPALFLTNIRTISPAARRAIFGNEGAQSIDNLVRLANAKQGTVRNLNNSRSGMVSNYRSVLSTVLLGLPGGGAAIGLGQAANVGTGVTGALTGAAVGLTGLGAARVIAHALMNERFTRALAQAPNTINPQPINAHFGRLRQIAAKDPNVRSVVEALEKKLLSHANDNATRVGAAAASPDEGPDKEERSQR